MMETLNAIICQYVCFCLIKHFVAFKYVLEFLDFDLGLGPALANWVAEAHMLTRDTIGIRYFQHIRKRGLALTPVMSSTMSYKRSVPATRMGRKE